MVGCRNLRNIKTGILDTMQRGRIEHRFLFTTDGFEMYEWAVKRLLAGVCISKPVRELGGIAFRAPQGQMQGGATQAMLVYIVGTPTPQMPLRLGRCADPVPPEPKGIWDCVAAQGGCEAISGFRQRSASTLRC